MTQNNDRFAGKIALITGGSSGIGAATARRLLNEGAQVIITGRDKARLDTAVEELGGRVRGGRVIGIVGDAADLADLDALAAAVRDRYGRLDVVFCNAGIGAFQLIEAVTETEFDRVVEINFKSVYFTIQKSLPLLSDQGAIVINASFAPYRGAPASALYTATKAAVHSLTRTLAAELARRRIRVNSVSPGFTDTPAFRAETTGAAAAVIATAVAAGRIGTPEDVAATVAFLAADEASYINGQDLLVDGGLITANPTPIL